VRNKVQLFCTGDTFTVVWLSLYKDGRKRRGILEEVKPEFLQEALLALESTAKDAQNPS
jgi:hypothetical protein